MVRAVESPKYPPPVAGGQRKQGPISARKLAATLWEIKEVTPSRRVGEEEEKAVLTKDQMGRRSFLADGSIRSGSLPRHLSDPSHSPVSEMMDQMDSGSLRRNLAKSNQRIIYNERNSGVLDSMSNTSLVEARRESAARSGGGAVCAAHSSSCIFMPSTPTLQTKLSGPATQNCKDG